MRQSYRKIRKEDMKIIKISLPEELCVVLEGLAGDELLDMHSFIRRHLWVTFMKDHCNTGVKEGRL